MGNTAIEGVSNEALVVIGLVALVLFARLESQGSVGSFVSTLIKVILWTGGIIVALFFVLAIGAMFCGLAAGI